MADSPWRNQYHEEESDPEPEREKAQPQPQLAQQPQPQPQPRPQQQQQPARILTQDPQAQQQVAIQRTGNLGGRTGAIRESRIKDRPQPKDQRDNSLKVKIELDLEVEVDLYARVQGDVTIGLM
ncbi:uncharacterized protein CIMG_07153 [Coccidioides immitis RS]|uniref:Uncharacterized protein n=3 Tax=Coccidioides immitis TaxID=5501 RepID=J3K9Q6_COCIM|nr:uncharacterized protein CIMG_07153 [Coccidioides immitis RS]EAS31674.3 hypothetical protein CIMG_07153 [Coccidioides immitis RS]KMU73468.1 hypothetical protein CISG_03603 [Coccidioides immitis RMSCC 3703]KMU87154.1 hypothetical protein CIHG_05094 [Coccidioides immitis H538.4]TPX24428.1 hypothetical protein DIZ76_013775 [Coccidioides immitis]